MPSIRTDLDDVNVYVTQMSTTLSSDSLRAGSATLPPIIPDTPRTMTTEMLISPKKELKRDPVKAHNRIPGYTGVVTGAGVRVVLLSHRRQVLASAGLPFGETGRNSNPLDRTGLKHVGLAPSRGKVVWHWEADLETRYVENVAEAKEVLGMGRVMALAAKWKKTTEDNRDEKCV